MNPLVARADRPVSGLERTWLAADRIHGPFVNQLVLEGTGVPGPEALRLAVDAAGRAHPGACLRLRGWLRGLRWTADGAPPRVRVEDGSTWDGHGPAGAPFLTDRLDPTTGPVVEVVLVRGADPGDASGQRLVFRTHHAAMDGRGTWLFASDVFRALRGEAPRGSESGPWTDLDYARMATEEPLPEPVADRMAPTGSPVSASFETTWARARVDGDFRGLMPRALVALWRASRVHTTDPLRFAVPVDLRRYRPDRRSTANLTGVLRLDLDGVTSVAQAHARVRARLSSALNAHHAARMAIGADRVRGLPLGLMSWAGRRIAKNQLQTGRFPVSASVSNLGRQDLSRVSAPAFRATRAFWIPPGSPSMPLFLTLNGDVDGLDLVATVPVGLASGGRLETLLASMAEALQSERDRLPAPSREDGGEP